MSEAHICKHGIDGSEDICGDCLVDERHKERDEIQRLQLELAERERELSTEKTAHQETQRQLASALQALQEQEDECEETERKWKECQEELAQLRRERAEANAFSQGAEAYSEWRQARQDHIAELQSELTSKEQQLLEMTSSLASMKQLETFLLKAAELPPEDQRGVMTLAEMHFARKAWELLTPSLSKSEAQSPKEGSDGLL